MMSGLDNMQDLDNALSKSLDDIIRENKSARGGARRMGGGRMRGGRGGGGGGSGGRGGRGGSGGGNRSGRGGRNRGGRVMNNNSGRGGGGGGRLINRNRYSAQNRNNNSNGNIKDDKEMQSMDNQRSNGERRGRGGRGRGNRIRGRRPGMGTISSRNMKPSFRGSGRLNNNNNNNSRILRNSGGKRNISSRESRPRVSPLKRNIPTSGTVIVQGLLPHVTSDDIKEIFGTIGVVMKAYVKYDGQTGKSTGEAEVVYSHRNDARRAQREMNGRLIDQAPITVRLAFQSPLIRSRTRPMLRGTARRGGNNRGRR